MCENKVSYYVSRGWYPWNGCTGAKPYDYREVFVPCGRTDPHGERAICQDCRDDPDVMRAIDALEENIRADNQASHSAGWGEW